MKGIVELYLQQFRTTMAMMFQYRASLFIWIIGHVLEPLVYLIVWSVVSRSGGGSVGGYTAAGFAAYFIVLMLVNHVTYTWIMYEFEYRIREGGFSFALLRPVHPIHSDIADNVSSKLITMPVMVALAIALSFGFHASFSLTPWSLVLFFPALFLAFLTRFLLEWTLALSAFWTTRVSAVNQMYFFLMLFLSGQIAPLSLLPAPVQVLASALPFKWLIGFPVQLFLGQLTPTAALAGIGIQVAWLIGSLLLLQLSWRAALRSYSAVGA